MTDLKKGDRVRVTLEGEVTLVDGDIYYFKIGGRYGTVTLRQSHSTVEVLPPPVEAFKPGDVLRHKTSKVLIFLGERGYYSSVNKDHNEYGHDGWDSKLSYFTSEWYERVELK